MTTIGSFGFDLVAHELGHMWFGDNITCATWQDIWINEGFATYANYLANEFLKGPEAAQQFITKAQTHAMSQPGGSIYIPSEEIYPGNEWRIFNGRLSYDKGAAVLHMLRHEINDDSLFFNVLKTYQQRFGGKVATGEDFKRVADSVTKKDFSNFFTQWYYGEGYPIYDIKWHQSDDSLYLESIQHTSTQSTRLFRMHLDFGIEYEDGSDTLIRLFKSDTMNHFSIPIHQHVSAIVVDPNHWTLQKVNSLIIDAVPSTKKLYHFTTYPNPVINKLQLRFDNQSQTQKKISIFASDGRLIYTTFSKNKVVNLDFSSYPHGIYIIAAGDKGQNMVQKIVH
jgi:aminopeptidase N